MANDSMIQSPLSNDSMIRTVSMTVNSYVIFIDQEIGDPDRYRDVVQVLATAGENDHVNFVVNSPGGRLDSMGQIIDAIGVCAADVSCTVLGAAYSAASMLACMIPDCQISDSAEFMIHTASYGSVGTTPNIKNHTDFVHRQISRLIDQCYGGFLTPEEIEQVKNGREYWFDATEARERMQKRRDFIENPPKPKKPRKPKTPAA